jgi:hypothetical protein
MTGKEYFLDRLLAMQRFEIALVQGDVVQARWTWKRVQYAAKAEITKLNRNKVKVRTIEPVRLASGEKVELWNQIDIPKMFIPNWNLQNCLLGKTKWLVKRRGGVDMVEVEAYSPYEAQRGSGLDEPLLIAPSEADPTTTMDYDSPISVIADGKERRITLGSLVSALQNGLLRLEDVQVKP